MLFHGYYILSTQPLIVSFIGDDLFLGKTELSLPEWFRPKHVLEHVSWWSATLKRMTRFKIEQVRHALNGRTLHLMVNSSDEEVARKRFFLRGAHFNHNIFINEHLYRPLNEQKHYDAIYLARLDAFKRHWLAKKIDPLMVVSYGGDLHTFCPELKHCEFNREFLPRPELVKKYNQAYSGLCLSAKEGAMFASCEYLLCGIPVVSTPNKGGRDEFFNAQNSIIVPPEPEAVAQAVQHWKESPPDPQTIRKQVLNQFNDLRKEYCNYIAKLINEEGGKKKNPEELMEKYFAAPNGMNSRFVHKKDLAKIKLQDFNI